MNHSHDRKFSFEKLSHLDNEKRRASQPADAIVEALRIEAHDVIADYGAGTGYTAFPLAQRLEELGGNGVVLALDVEPRMLELIRQRSVETGLAHRIREISVRSEAQASVFSPGELDKAVLVNVYHELPSRPAILAHIFEALRLEGTILVVDWKKDTRTDLGPPADHRVSPGTCLHELLDAGFKNAHEVNLFEDFYAVFAVKL